MKTIVTISVPRFLFTHPTQTGLFAKTLVTRHALNNFNREAYEAACTHSNHLTTTFTINSVGLECLNRYQEQHVLASRNQAVIAIMAAVYATDKPINVIAKVSVPKIESNPVEVVPVFKALAMFGARG